MNKQLKEFYSNIKKKCEFVSVHISADADDIVGRLDCAVVESALLLQFVEENHMIAEYDIFREAAHLKLLEIKNESNC